MTKTLLPFAAVAALGFAVQVLMIELLAQVTAWPLAFSTIIAVEAAVLHNFAWHERWTWRHRVSGSNRLRRLLLFHATNGFTSMAGNVAFSEMLMRTSAMNSLMRSLISVALTGAINFAAADRIVFSHRGHKDEVVRLRDLSGGRRGILSANPHTISRS